MFTSASALNVTRATLRPTFQKRNSTIRVNRVTRAISVDDVTGAITSTVKEVQSVRGAKDVLQRVALYGVPLTTSVVTIQALHFGGAGLGPAMKIAGVGACAGPLAPLAAIWLFSVVSPYVQAIVSLAGVLQVGEDIPALFCGISFALAACSLWHYGSAGFTNIWTRHWVVWQLGMATTLLTSTNKVKEVLGRKVDGIRKVALIGPGMVMAALFFQQPSMAAFEAAGFSGPGVLGPVAAAVLHPLWKWFMMFGGLAYLTDAETKYSSLIIGLSMLIVSISITPQLVAPLGLMGSWMHLYAAITLFKEVTPADSLIPSV